MSGAVEKWIDTHVHLDPATGQTPADLAPGLQEVFAREPVDLRFVASPGMAGIQRMVDRADGVVQAQEDIRSLMQLFPHRVFGSCMVNPHFMNASLEAMDRCFGEWGFVQLGELVTYLMNYNMSSPAAEQIVRKAVEHGVPVHVHISTSNAKPQGHFSSGEEELTDLLNLVDKIPDGRYIVAHGVGAPLIDPPVIDTYLDLVESRYGSWPPNLWIEIMHFHAAGVRSALERIPSTRILAGTDWDTSGPPPYPPYGTVFGPAEDEQPYPPFVASLVGFLETAGADAAAVRRIAYQNAGELFGARMA